MTTRVLARSARASLVCSLLFAAVSLLACREAAEKTSPDAVSEGPLLEVVTDSPTIDGTDAGELIRGGFNVTTQVSGSPDGDLPGFISAVVLSFQQPMRLRQGERNTVAHVSYRLRSSPASYLFFCL